MNKILTFIVNEFNELLLLKGSPNDPQFNESFWYVVTGGYEKIDKSLTNTVKREVQEETGLLVKKCIYLNWIFKYKSLGRNCTEYAYISFVNKDNVVLNEENIDYRWCKIDEFIKKIRWFGDKNELRKVLINAFEEKIYLKIEKVEEY